jgi:hypothetical protein
MQRCGSRIEDNCIPCTDSLRDGLFKHSDHRAGRQPVGAQNLAHCLDVLFVDGLARLRDQRWRFFRAWILGIHLFFF